MVTSVRKERRTKSHSVRLTIAKQKLCRRREAYGSCKFFFFEKTENKLIKTHLCDRKFEETDDMGRKKQASIRVGQENANTSFVCMQKGGRRRRKAVEGEDEQGTESEYLKPSGTSRLNRITW